MPRLDPMIEIEPFCFTDCLYDAENDVAYLSIGTPRAAITWESPEGHLLRLDPNTDELVGITFLHLKERIDAGGLKVTFPESTIPSSGELPTQACKSMTVPQTVLAVCCS